MAFPLRPDSKQADSARPKVKRNSEVLGPLRSVSLVMWDRNYFQNDALLVHTVETALVMEKVVCAIDPTISKEELESPPSRPAILLQKNLRT